MKKLVVNENPSTHKKPSYHHGDLRSALLVAAEQELSEKGIEAFSLRGVAKRAGVSHAAPSHHYSDTKGLLTALAAIGFERFLESQLKRKRLVSNDPKVQLAASGLGYIDFAIANPALFRLMFSSEKPDSTNMELEAMSSVAFNRLLDDVLKIVGSDPRTDPAIMADVMATWALVHGLADLLIGTPSSLTTYFENMTKIERENIWSNMILRACRVKI